MRLNANYIILGLLLLLAIAGCIKQTQSPGENAHINQLNRANNTKSQDQPIRNGPDVTTKTDDQPTEIEIFRDPGATLLIAEMINAIGLDDEIEPEPLVSLRRFRNQSRSTRQEVDELRSRLFQLFTQASAIQSVRFADKNEADTEYTLGGTLYLIEHDGEEYWEIYFTLKPAGANWTIWRNDQPVRLNRNKSKSQDTITYVTDY